MPLFEFKCPNGHITEKLFLGEPDSVSQQVLCKECGCQTNLVITSRSSFRLKPGESGGFYSPSRG